MFNHQDHRSANPPKIKKLLGRNFNRTIIRTEETSKPLKENLLVRKMHSTVRKNFRPSPLLIIKQSNLSGDCPKTKLKSYTMGGPTYKAKRPAKIELVPIKEAMTNKEWLSKTKESLIQAFSDIVNRSNALEVADSQPLMYYIGKGNNSGVVRQIMANRTSWIRVTDKSSAQLIWTQWKDRETLRLLPIVENQALSFEKLSISINCSFKFNHKRVEASGLGYDLISLSDKYVRMEHNTCSFPIKIHNRIYENNQLVDKKCLFYNLSQYYRSKGENPFRFIPTTFHIKNCQDKEFQEFEEMYKPCSLWILKPAENSNRGYGITVCSSIDQVKAVVSEQRYTMIVQKYIENPLLIQKRKFDIRCFALITIANGVVQGYFYNEGYLRTASRPFSLVNISDKMIHLTNDAVQKKSENYGKFENGNKLSYGDLHKHLETKHNASFYAEILPQMRDIVRDTIEAVYPKLQKRNFSFEIFGYDFLLDSKLNPWLLEVNTNPCLELSAPLLSRIIPAMLDNSLRIAVDPLFPSLKRSEVPLENKYELIFHSHST